MASAKVMADDLKHEYGDVTTGNKISWEESPWIRPRV